MKWLDKLKPTKGAAYIKGNALPESDHETATGRQLYTITAIRKAYDAGYEARIAPLTDDQISSIERAVDAEWHSDDIDDSWPQRFARAIEAKLKEGGE